MVRERAQKPDWQLKIAKERMNKLFDEAEGVVYKDIALANRYVELARKIGMRYNIRVPRNLREKFCRYCYAYLKNGKTSEIDKKGDILHVKCLKCGKVTKRAA